MRRSHEIDMTTGPIFSKILMFVLPLMASGSICSSMYLLASLQAQMFL